MQNILKIILLIIVLCNSYKVIIAQDLPMQTMSTKIAPNQKVVTVLNDSVKIGSKYYYLGTVKKDSNKQKEVEYKPTYPIRLYKPTKWQKCKVYISYFWNNYRKENPFTFWMYAIFIAIALYRVAEFIHELIFTKNKLNK